MQANKTNSTTQAKSSLKVREFEHLSLCPPPQIKQPMKMQTYITHPFQLGSSYFHLANRVQRFTSNQACLITIEPHPWNLPHHRNPFQPQKHQ